MNIWAIINFVVFVGLLWVLLRKPAAAFWSKRAEAVSDTIRQSTELHAQAKQRIHDLETRMAHIEGEIDGMRIKLHEDGAAEKAQILSLARIEAERIRTEAVTIGRQEIERARQQLKRDMVDAAMSLAESDLANRIDEPVKARLLADSAVLLGRSLG